MTGLLRLGDQVDRLNRLFALVAIGLVFASCMISAGNAVSRYLFDLSSNAWLEIQWQMFAGIFLLGAPWVLKVNEHVRVDLVYGSVGSRTKLWIDVFGLVFFLLPVCVIMIEMSLPWFMTSFRQGEISANAGGLPVWPVKALLPLGFVLLMLQGLTELVRRIAALRGMIAIDTRYEKPLQ